MSLIADALKKAQASSLARRYPTAQPAEGSPVIGGPLTGTMRVAFASFLKGNSYSTTLMVGLSSGIILISLLYIYFSFGPGKSHLRSSSTSSTATTATRASFAVKNPTQRLSLTPPPSFSNLEPLRFEGKSQVAQKPLGAPSKVETAGILRGELGAGDDQSPLVKEKKVKRVRTSNVSITSDLSQEVRSRFNLALLHHERKRFPQARQEYEKVIQMWPLYAEAYNNLGLVYKELGMQGQAIAHFERALTLNPEYVRAYHNLGVVFHTRGDLIRAKKNYLAALTLDRGNLTSLNNLGLIYREEKRFYDARKLLEKALLLKADSPQIQYNLALILEELGEIKGARLHYRKFLDLKGEDFHVLAGRVETHLQELAARRK